LLISQNQAKSDFSIIIAHYSIFLDKAILLLYLKIWYH
jgi:hypothetical protein